MGALGGSFKKATVKATKCRKCIKCGAYLLEETSFALSLWRDCGVALAVDAADQQLYKISKDRKRFILSFQINNNLSRTSKIYLVLAWETLVEFVCVGVYISLFQEGFG